MVVNGACPRGIQWHRHGAQGGNGPLIFSPKNEKGKEKERKEGNRKKRRRKKTENT